MCSSSLVKVLVETHSHLPSYVILVMNVVEEEVDDLGFLHVTVMAGQVAACGEEDIDVRIGTAAGVEAGGMQFVPKALCSGDHMKFAIKWGDEGAPCSVAILLFIMLGHHVVGESINCSGSEEGTDNFVIRVMRACMTGVMNDFSVTTSNEGVESTGFPFGPVFRQSIKIGNAFSSHLEGVGSVGLSRCRVAQAIRDGASQCVAHGEVRSSCRGCSWQKLEKVSIKMFRDNDWRARGLLARSLGVTEHRIPVTWLE